MAKPERNVRELLKAIGIGDFNATMIIQYMFVAPATTDPRSAPIIHLVQAMQQALLSMGADLQVSGYLDTPTATALYQVVGPNWERISWADNIRAIVDARRVGFSAAPPVASVAIPVAAPSMGGVFDFLPDVPGGFLTYLIGAGIAYHYLRKR